MIRDNNDQFFLMKNFRIWNWVPSMSHAFYLSAPNNQMNSNRMFFLSPNINRDRVVLIKRRIM